MKNLLFICSLLVVAITAPVFGQEESSSVDAAVQAEQGSDHTLSIGIDVEKEINDDEKIKKVTDFVSEFDSEIGRELALELDGLSDHEKAELLVKLDKGFTFGGDIDEFPAGVVFIALPAVILIFGMPLFLLIALLSAGNRKRKQKMELVDLYIKSDRDIPEHVITALDNGGAASSLKSGLTLTAVGLGVVAAFNVLGAEEAGAFGLIPMFLGIARLIFWFVVERKAEPETGGKPERES